MEIDFRLTDEDRENVMTLRQIIEEDGVARVARALGVSQAAISLVRSGKRLPGRRIMVAAASVYSERLDVRSMLLEGDLHATGR